MLLCASFVLLSLPITGNVYNFICTGNKVVYFLWLHSNNVYNMAVLEQLSRILEHRESSMFWKIKWIVFSLLWTDWFDLHMQLGPVSSLVYKSKFKRPWKMREISEPIIQPAVVNVLNSDWMQQSTKTWSTSSCVVNFSQLQIIIRYCQVSYKKCSWSN